MKHTATIVFLLLFSNAYHTIAQSCFVQTRLDRRSVYAQQPFKVTFTVYTATWFTAPLDFDNIQVPDAFILPFDRTTPGMFTIGSKQYAGIQFYFIVFPYKPGSFTIPAIRITAHTPPEGRSTAQEIKLSSKPESFVVKPTPADFTGSSWFVAKNVSLSETWNKPLGHLKAGDVVKRTIAINAQGTLPQFIPGVGKDSLNWASVYADDPQLTDTRDAYDANGIRRQTFTYLLEKDGSFTLPAQTITWWNPYAGKVYSKSIAAKHIQVQPNPNLGILTTLRDSLHATAAVTAPAPQKKGPLLIWGIAWYWFVLIAAGALLVLYVLIRKIWRMVNALIQWRKRILQSEGYWFAKLQYSAWKPDVLLRNLYRWWDRSGITHNDASFTQALQADHAQQLKQETEAWFQSHYGHEAINPPDKHGWRKALRLFRKNRQQQQQIPHTDIAPRQEPWEEV